MMVKHTYSRGLTLVELLVALTIAAIVAMIAVPMYGRYSVLAYEAEAQADLLRCAAGMERHAATRFSYVEALGPGIDTGPVTDALCSPVSTHYIFSVAEADAHAFVLVATPAAGSVVDGRAALTINAAGVRSWAAGSH
jgi:type IV pilus assembly protein PilE